VKNIDLNGINLFQMQTCVTVAQYKSITKAADFLHTSQPALSKKIAQVEELLGLTLFIRGKNTSLRTTAEGLYLCNEWARMLGDFRSTYTSALGIQDTNTEHIVIVTTPSAESNLFISPVISEFRKIFPNVEIRVEYCTIPEAKDRLCAGTADVVMLIPYLNMIFNIEELKWQMIAHCPLSVGMLKTNPLAKKSSLTIKELETQRFVLPQNLEFTKYVSGICENHGFVPSVSYYAKYFHGISMCIGNDNEVIVTDRFLHSYYNSDCQYFDLPDTESGVMMATRRHESNILVQNFASNAIRIMRGLHYLNAS